MFGLTRNSAQTPDNGPDNGQGANVETLDAFKERVRLAVADIAARYFGAELPARELLASLGLDSEPAVSRYASVTVTFLMPSDTPDTFTLNRDAVLSAMVDAIDRTLIELPISTQEIVREWLAEHTSAITVKPGRNPAETVEVFRA